MRNYLNMLEQILYTGNKRNTRAGPTRALFGQHLSWDLRRGFPAVTTKKLYFESVKNELAGFLRNEQDASKMGSKIWEADAERWHSVGGSGSRFPTDMGRVYGAQMRDWWPSLSDGDESIDQLQEVVDRIKVDPTDRRLLVSMWNPGELGLMCLPPCHYSFQFFVADGKLSCLFNMRSVDTFLGLPFDIAYYALLTHIVAQQSGLQVDGLYAFLGDTHIYENHVPQVKELIKRRPYLPPMLGLDRKVTINNFVPGMAGLFGYEHHPALSAKLNVG